MTITGVFGVIFGLLAIPVFLRGQSFQRMALAVGLAGVHLAAAMTYYNYTLTNFADSYSYYHWDAFYRVMPWTELGTAFAGHITQVFKHSFNATYLDCFLVFQGFGFWGLVTMMEVFREIALKTNTKEQTFAPYLLFLPSIQFWTTAIGKDPPVFLAVALFTWSMLNPRKRIFAFAAGIALVVLFRAHIALAMSIALTAALLLEKRISTGRKAFLLMLSCVGLVFLISTVQQTFNVDVVSGNSLSNFMQTRALSEATDQGGSYLGTSSLPVRLVSLLFRPFFFDAKNAMGMVASLENVGSVLLFGYFFVNFRTMRQLSKQVLFIRFSIFFAIILIAILTVLNYNVGLGSRERVMAYPPLFALLLATSAVRRLNAASKSRAVSVALAATQADARLPTV